MIEQTMEYQAIKSLYGDKRAKRSEVPLMNHIDEGIEILDKIGASFKAKLAFAIHPIVQNNEDIDVESSEAYELAVEYKRYANAYLCCPGTDWIDSVEKLHSHLLEVNSVPMSLECAHMLLADKIQNKKDFMIHHYGTHVRSEELYNYFNLWIEYLFTLPLSDG